MRFVLFALLPLLAGLAPAFAETTIVLEQPEQLPPGYPPKMGQVTLTGPEGTTTFTTYDFSVGAFDASAFFDTREEKPHFTIMGYPNENPDAEAGTFWLTTQFDVAAKAGSKGRYTLVEIATTKDHEGPRQSSAARKASLTIDSFTKEDPTATSGYGHVTGHFTARMCQVDHSPAVRQPGSTCHNVSGSFDTQVQYQP
jgi:hypothetical protein